MGVPGIIKHEAFQNVKYVFYIYSVTKVESHIHLIFVHLFGLPVSQNGSRLFLKAIARLFAYEFKCLIILIDKIRTRFKLISSPSQIVLGNGNFLRTRYLPIGRGKAREIAVLIKIFISHHHE